VISVLSVLLAAEQSARKVAAGRRSQLFAAASQLLQRGAMGVALHRRKRRATRSPAALTGTGLAYNLLPVRAPTADGSGGRLGAGWEP